MEDLSSSTNEEDSEGDSATMVTPPLFPKLTREEAEHLYQEMISAMKNHNQGFSDLIGDSPHATIRSGQSLISGLHYAVFTMMW
jgi:hypothetical protein